MEKNASAAVKPPARAIRKITLGRNTYSVPEIVVGVLLLVPSIVFLVFTFVIPVVQVVELSLTNFNMATGEMSFIGLRNYRYLLENSDFWLSMWNTCKYSAAKLIFDTSLALLIAVQLDKNIPLKKFLRSTYFAPVVVPMVASSLILGLPELKWLYSEHTAMISILLFSIWKGLGYNVVLFLSGLQNISDSYLEAARLDGANEWQLFWKVKFPLLRPITNFVVIMCIINSFKVKFPLLRPITNFVVIMCIINSFKVFTEINVMTPDGGPLGSTLLIVNYIYEQAFTNGRMGRASAAALLLFVVIFILTQIRSAMDARKDVDYE